MRRHTESFCASSIPQSRNEIPSSKLTPLRGWPGCFLESGAFDDVEEWTRRSIEKVSQALKMPVAAIVRSAEPIRAGDQSRAAIALRILSDALPFGAKSWLIGCSTSKKKSWNLRLGPPSRKT